MLSIYFISNQYTKNVGDEGMAIFNILKKLIRLYNIVDVFYKVNWLWW